MTENSSTTGHNRAVARWLLLCCSLVFVMVILGGFTRLTGSGLSMVDWQPLLGWLPPMTDSDWQQVFDRYRQSPEFQKVNSHMDVDAFKGIFWLEFLHRLLGRTIGIVFIVPLIVFVVRGYIRAAEWPKYLLMFILGGMQGVLGWYMVKSGLVDQPHVSQHRLTAHLVAAFAIYGYMFWVALSLLFPATGIGPRPWYRRSLLIASMVFITVVSGGFVAGLKAGKIYNTFPMMGDDWVPPGILSLRPVWRNLFENAAMVQFDHRVMAIATFVVTLVFWFNARHADLPARSRPAVNALLHVISLQVALGVTTLLLAVPILLGVAHQAVAMLLFTVTLYLAHSLRN